MGMEWRSEERMTRENQVREGDGKDRSALGDVAVS